jgi:hypothetical protein
MERWSVMGKKSKSTSYSPTSKIPASIEDWKKKNGGIHEVMTSVMIRQDATKKEVTQAIDDAIKMVQF